MTINETHLSYVQTLLESDFPEYEAKLYNDFGNDLNPYISVSEKDDYSCNPIHHSLIVKLSQLLPWAHIYVQASDCDPWIVIQSKTYEQISKEQVERRD